MSEAIDYADPFGEHADYYAELEAEQNERNAQSYEDGLRAGEMDGRNAWHDFIEPVKVHEPERTPWIDGYDDGFCAGWHLARTGQ